MTSPHLFDLHPAQWPQWFETLGFPSFQGRNAARWVFQKGAKSWQEMTDLPASLRQQLEIKAPLQQTRLVHQSEAADGACKVLLALADGATVEAVGMPGTDGRTICLSTQVGCPVRCRFCASGMEGLARNLSQGEILEQALWLQRSQGAFQRVVVMGMGEAGFNLPAVLGALDVLLDAEGFGISARRITLSTVGPKGAIPAIGAWGRPIHLAISVHAADDELRHQLIPGVKHRSLVETLDEAEALFEANGREYTVEYVLLAGVNDGPEHAQALASVLYQRRCHVNLIPFNAVPELPYACPAPMVQEEFAKRLRSGGLSVTLRRSLGGASDAACGQLRRRNLAPDHPHNV